MPRTFKTVIARVVRWVFTALRVVLGLVLLFILRDVVLVFLVFAMPALVLALPYVKPRFVMPWNGRRGNVPAAADNTCTDPGEVINGVRTHGAHD